MKISVSMITLNEARHIKRALSSCTFADEIVVVDGGSTDGTIEILKSFEKVKLIEHPWEGHFGKQRQISLEHCSGDWIVRLDADEVFSEEFEKGIRSLLEATPPDVVGYRVRKCNLVGDENHYAKNHDRFEDTPRIFRNLPGVRWIKHVHEIPVGLDGRIENWDVYIVHYNIIDKQRFIKKGLFYSKIPDSGFNTPEELYYREYDIQPRPKRSKVSSHVPPFITEKEQKRLPKIAIIRGPNLNPWEMQNYEPLVNKFDITAYTTTKPNFNIDEINLPVIKLPAHPENPAYMIGLEFALFDTDLIYTADTTWIFSYQAALIKKKFNKPIVCLQWENIPFVYEEHEQMKFIKKVVRESADHFIAVTERAKEALILEGVPAHKITVTPIGIDTDRFKPDRELGFKTREELGISHDETVILFTGRMVWEKGIYDLIHAAKLVNLKLKDAKIRYVVIGKGSELVNVKNRVNELNLDSYFIFIESYPYNKIHKVYNLTDIFVLPSIPVQNWKEQLGMVLVEAMACGVPVVSTLSGSIPEVVGEAGMLVQPSDPHSLSLALIELIRDKEKRIKLGTLGRQRAVTHFSSTVISKQIGEILDNVLKNYRTHRSHVSLTENCGIELSCKPSSTGETIDVIEPPPVKKYITEEYYRQERKELKSLIPDNPERVLDVGCGEGMLGKWLLSNGAKEVIGIDINPEVCKTAKNNLSEVICGDIEKMELPFEEGYFDCIILADVLEHLKDPLSVLKKLKRILAPDGSVVASIPNVRFYNVINMLVEGRWLYEDAGILDRSHLRFFTKREIEELFDKASLEITGLSYNIDNKYNEIDPYSKEIRIGRLTINILNPEDLKDLFVYQYLVRARKKDVVFGSTDKDLNLELKKLEEYLLAHPADMEALFRHAEICYSLKKYDKAIDSLETILMFDKDNKNAMRLKKLIFQTNHVS